jgi:DNA-binding NtrC family response regulator
MADGDFLPAGTRVLIIDDEPSIRRSLARVLTERGFAVDVAASGKEGLAAAERWDPRVVLLDLQLPDATGLSILRALKARDQSTAVLMITAYGNAGEAVEAIRLGAVDFLKKPYEMEEVVLAVTSAARRAALETELALYRERDAQTLRQNTLIGECDAMVALREMIAKVARGSDTTVLLEGESGTGKELVARAIHHESARRDAPLIELNCAAVQEALLENELFGHERGAFTDAREFKRGLAELADGGTLFLDEVADMPPAIQAKLLRFLDGQTFRRVGGTRDVAVDVRVIAATNKSMASAVAEGTFRADLYYRLRVVSLILPPLRERGADVELLALHFLHHFAHRFHKRFVGLADETRGVLHAYHWPGNVRELRNVLERAVLLEDDDVLRPEHLPPEIAMLHGAPLNDTEGSPNLDELPVTDESGEILSVEEITDRHIVRVLDRLHGNKSQAARALGLSRRGLLYRLRAMQERMRGEEDGVTVSRDVGTV